MKLERILFYAGVYVLGIYALQKWVLKKDLNLPTFIDPLGAWVGYAAPSPIPLTPPTAMRPTLLSPGNVLSTLPAPSFDFSQTDTNLSIDPGMSFPTMVF